MSSDSLRARVLARVRVRAFELMPVRAAADKAGHAVALPRDRVAMVDAAAVARVIYHAMFFFYGTFRFEKQALTLATAAFTAFCRMLLGHLSSHRCSLRRCSLRRCL